MGWRPRVLAALVVSPVVRAKPGAHPLRDGEVVLAVELEEELLGGVASPGTQHFGYGLVPDHSLLLNDLGFSSA
jgi:hypothetical protein